MEAPKTTTDPPTDVQTHSPCPGRPPRGERYGCACPSLQCPPGAGASPPNADAFLFAARAGACAAWAGALGQESFSTHQCLLMFFFGGTTTRCACVLLLLFWLETNKNGLEQRKILTSVRRGAVQRRRRRVQHAHLRFQLHRVQARAVHLIFRFFVSSIPPLRTHAGGVVSCVETYLLSEVVKAGLARVPFLADSSDASPIHEVPRLEAHRFSSASSYRPGREDEKANGTARKFRPTRMKYNVLIPNRALTFWCDGI